MYSSVLWHGIMVIYGNGGGMTVMLPEIGQEVYLQVEDGEDITTNYKSKIIDIHADSMSIYLPVQQNTGTSKVFRTGTEMQVSHFGKDGSKYEYPLIILENVNDNIPYTRVSKPGRNEIQRKQRRNFVRIPSSTDVSLELIEGKGRQIHFTTRTVDISGGGIAVSFPSTYDIQLHDQFNIWLVLPVNKEILHANFIGRVIRIIKGTNEGYNIASIEIINISPKDQQNIVRFSFECEVELRKKGLK